ncbi:MAG: hypothetical protein HY370_08170 [Proteobacteria bacterium]|nr:hypothetical protein [Pseudomonadota bacterium]
MTARLRQAAELLGITLLDHIILGEGRIFSFADQGWPGAHTSLTTPGSALTFSRASSGN